MLMGKYYCKECKSELKISQEVIDAWEEEDKNWNDDSGYEKYEKWDGKHVLCDICSNESQEVWMDHIPDWETPAQYENRTGKPYPDDGLVWWRLEKTNEPVWGEWHVGYYKDVIEECERINEFGGVYQIVIADPPVPPPDGWQPKEVAYV